MSAPDGDRWIEIAAVTGVHGLQGELRLRVHSGDAAALKRYKALRLDPLGRPVTIASLREDAKGVRVRFREVADRTAAEPLRGQKLMVERAALPPAAPDEVYLADLIGMAVTTLAGDDIGTVIATPNYGAGDLIEVRRPDGSEFLAPLQPVAITSIDEAARRIIIEPGFAEA